MLPKLKREAVAVASGNVVFAYSYSGRVMKLAERGGEILSLTIYRGRLCDSGDYDGVRDTLTGETIAGKGAKWRRIAKQKRHTDDIDDKPVIEDELYGAMETGDESLYGIHELDIRRRYPQAVLEYSQRYHRNGRTDVLSAWNLGYEWDFLVDGGKYFYYPGAKADDLSVRDSWYFDRSLTRGISKAAPVTAFASTGSDWYYYSLPFQVAARSWRRERGQIIFNLKGGFTDALYELQDLEINRCWSGIEESHWDKFCHLLKKLKLRLPPNCFIYNNDGAIKEIAPVNYAEIPEHEKWRMTQNLEENLMSYIRDKEGISALAFVDSALFAGCRNGNLIVPDERLQEEGKHIVHEFKYPINAICTIDEETFDSGIRQRVVRNIQMRAVHAKQKQAALRRVA